MVILRTEFLCIKVSIQKVKLLTGIHLQSQPPGKHNENQKQNQKLNYSSKFCKDRRVTLACCKAVNQKKAGEKS